MLSPGSSIKSRWFIGSTTMDWITLRMNPTCPHRENSRHLRWIRVCHQWRGTMNRTTTLLTGTDHILLGQLCPFRCTWCFIGNRFPDATLKWAYICRHSGLHHRFPVGKIPSVPYMDADRVTHKFTINHLFASKLQCIFAVASYWRVVSTKSLILNRYFRSN